MCFCSKKSFYQIIRNEIDEKFFDVFNSIKEGMTVIIRNYIVETNPMMMKKTVDKEVEKIIDGNEMSLCLVERLVSEVMNDFEKRKQIFRILATKFSEIPYKQFKWIKQERTFKGRKSEKS